MFSFLDGIVVFKSPGEVLLSVNGLGFKLIVPVNAHSQIPEKGKKAFFWVRSFYREKEKDFVHYGFIDKRELELFNLIVKVPSVGPQVAMSLISHLGYEGFIKAVDEGDVDALNRVPKVGKKTAKRLIAELGKERFALETESSAEKAVLEALVSLGYTAEEARKAILGVRERWRTEEELLKLALKELGKGL